MEHSNLESGEKFVKTMKIILIIFVTIVLYSATQDIDFSNLSEFIGLSPENPTAGTPAACPLWAGMNCRM